ncbi:hypothetical protein ACQPX6_08905 [Actinomycetospora sp. CA-101289]|uniref:hypothetical protein n=1 Tax=Actinomycetospora sp. CA-101289 TaxID=3239893 RepID=UPI003D988252
MRHDHELSPDLTPTTSTHRDSTDDTAAPPRGYVERLFAAALDGDPVAGEELADLAPWDSTAAAAFEALAVAEFVRSHVGVGEGLKAAWAEQPSGPAAEPLRGAASSLSGPGGA